MRRIHEKICCLIDNCHHKCSRWLCQNYRIILLPEFKMQEMVRHGKWQIRSKTARMMLTWSHFWFRQYLLYKVREYPWCWVIICTVEYTSKTCGCCGYIHQKLGGPKVLVVDPSLIGTSKVLVTYFFATLPCYILIKTKSQFMPALGPIPWDPCDSCRTCEEYIGLTVGVVLDVLILDLLFVLAWLQKYQPGFVFAWNAYFLTFVKF